MSTTGTENRTAVELRTLRPIDGAIKIISAYALGGEWICEQDPRFESILNKIPVPSRYHLDYDMEMAQEAQRYYRGEIIDHRLPVTREYVPGRVY